MLQLSRHATLVRHVYDNIRSLQRRLITPTTLGGIAAQWTMPIEQLFSSSLSRVSRLHAAYVDDDLTVDQRTRARRRHGVLFF